jgi:hypothetical protein
MSIPVIGITKINLEPNDVLVVKLFGDQYTSNDVEGIKASFDAVFPDNKVFVTTLPTGFDIKFEVLAPVPKPAICEPVTACADCSCGKKEALAGD